MKRFVVSRENLQATWNHRQQKLVGLDKPVNIREDICRQLRNPQAVNKPIRNRESIYRKLKNCWQQSEEYCGLVFEKLETKILNVLPRAKQMRDQATQMANTKSVYGTFFFETISESNIREESVCIIIHSMVRGVRARACTSHTNKIHHAHAMNCAMSYGYTVRRFMMNLMYCIF